MAEKKTPPTQKDRGLRPALTVRHHSGRFSRAPLLLRPSLFLRAPLSLVATLLFVSLFTGACVVEPSSKRPGASAHTARKKGGPCTGGPCTKVEKLPPFEYAVVGTIHKFHLIQKNYPLQTLKALVEAYSPDLVLVEIRPSAFKHGHYEDGPFEMAYVTHIAKNKRIPVVPIDWWLAQEAGTPGGDAPKSIKARRRFMKAVKPYMKGLSWPPTFDQVHSVKYTRRMLMVINARARLLGGTPSWNRRQAWFHHWATQALLHHRPKKVMAFVGAQHRPELKAHLAALGGLAKDPKEILDAAHTPLSELAKHPIPSAVVEAWRAGIRRLEKKRDAAKGPLHAAYKKKIHYFQVAVRQKGRCCANPKELFPPKAKPPRPVPRPQPKPETKPKAKPETKPEATPETPREGKPSEGP